MRSLPPVLSAGRRSTEGRGGYTLLELLIASVLIATLMAAVWGLMSMYSSFLVAGREQAAEQQLSRSLIDLVAADLHSTVPRLDETTIPAWETVSHDNAPPLSSSNSRVGSRPLPIEREPVEFEATEALGPNAQSDDIEPLAEIPFSGDDHSLVLLSVRHEPDFELATAENSDQFAVPERGGIDAGADDFGGGTGLDRGTERAAASEWSQIVYYFVPPRAQRRDDRELAPGLHRFEIPVEYLGLLTQSDDTLANQDAGFVESLEEIPGGIPVDAIEQLRALGIQEGNHEHIPEVVACRFEYLSGSTWQRRWDAFPPWEQPVAVRVSVRLLSSNEHRELAALLGSDAIDESSAVARSPVETIEESVGDGDPFQAFHPRLYQRTVLLGPGRKIHGPRDADVSEAGESVVNSRSPAGGA